MATAFTLESAVEKVAAIHPELRLFGGRQDMRRANLHAASLKTALTLDSLLENVGGTGAYTSFDQAQLTVTLADALKRAASWMPGGRWRKPISMRWPRSVRLSG